jgi:hypothetical protein
MSAVPPENLRWALVSRRELGLTAFVAAVVARHAFAFAEDSTPTCQRQERTVGHDKPGLVS